MTELATITQHTATSGFTVARFQPGPAKEVHVTFTSQGHESEIKVSCPGGNPKPDIKERSI